MNVKIIIYVENQNEEGDENDEKKRQKRATNLKLNE